MTKPVLFALLFSQSPRLASAARASVSVSNKDSAIAGECGKDVAVPSEEDSLQEYFDGLRQEYGILGENASFIGEGGMVPPETCTKKDVCLLMRQLDMDFYNRAREGLLQDVDYQIPPTKGWVKKGTCDGQESVRGFKMKPVNDPAVCSAEAKKDGKSYGGQIVSKKKPSGCVAIDNRVYLNTHSNSIAAGTTSTSGGRFYMKTTSTGILCEMDRSLSESAAAYYSPYKLKTSMIGREAQSTSCSFGMYAFLAKLRETMSPCAKILTYQTHSAFASAEVALDLAASLEAKGKYEEAEKLKQYVESIRQKYVLIDIIANEWCPSIWTGTLLDGTCKASRTMAWTAEGQVLERAENKKSGGKKKPSGKPNGRLAAAHAAHGGAWSGVGNQGLLSDIDDLIASIQSEDEAAESLLSSADEDDFEDDVATGVASLQRYKLALTEQSCEYISDDETLADALERKPELPPDFFKDADAK